MDLTDGVEKLNYSIEGGNSRGGVCFPEPISLSLIRRAVVASLLLDDIHRQRNHRAHVAERRGKNHRIAFLCELAKLGQVVIGDTELYRFETSRLLNRFCDLTNTLAVASAIAP